jgi:hypothetical protein
MLLHCVVLVKHRDNFTLPLYERENWCFTLGEEYRLRVFENRAVRRILGPEREKVAKGWRRLHNEEPHNLYASPDIIGAIKSRKIRWAENVTRMGQMRIAYSILVGKPEGKRPLGRPRRAWENNIGMNLREIKCEGVDWIHLAQHRVQTVMNLRVP